MYRYDKCVAVPSWRKMYIFLAGTQAPWRQSSSHELPARISIEHSALFAVKLIYHDVEGLP